VGVNIPGAHNGYCGAFCTDALTTTPLAEEEL